MATNRLHQDYTVAWLCALPCEMAAAEAMLDEKHSDLPTATEDDNTYILGRVYSHNVVIACCRSGVYGTTSASTCAIQLQATFRSIRFFLLVGIGGGVPAEKVDIRLGDVVVSKPTREFGGVVQYDYGKTMSGGRFVRTGLLNKPRSVLLTALARLEAAHKAAPSKIPAILAEMVERNPGMGEKFTYQGKHRDYLFDSEYEHDGENDTCYDCDTARLVSRPDRMSSEPVAHYGLIASGNQVIKHAPTRDKLARELGILCFEMEAAGVMDEFQCLVVRGICDYSDSHKNKQWQEYAAATAAAFAKELLSVIHAVQMADAPPAVSCYRGSAASYGRGRSTTDMISRGRDDANLLPRISDYDEKKIHRRLLQKRLVGTTQWFLDHPDFKAWFKDRTISNLWCSGKIGSGKTMIALVPSDSLPYCQLTSSRTTAIEAALYRSAENCSPTVFFYCESERPGTLVDTYILSSLIKQLCGFLHLNDMNFPEHILAEIRKFFGPERIQPDWIDLTHIFTLLSDLAPDCVYIIDGLDAVDQQCSKSLLGLFHSVFSRFGSSNRVRLLLFSRDQVPGYINITTFIPGIRHISTSANVMRDIELYIDTSIEDKSLYRTLTDNAKLLGQVKERLLADSSDMFLWVYLQLEILWDTCHTDAEIRTALAQLPKGLEEVYSSCIDRITLRHSFAPRVLKWVSFALRPLHVDELREAVSFGLDDTEWNEEGMPQRDVLVACCANLVIVDHTDDCVRFAHSSVNDYLKTHLAQKDKSTGDLDYPTAETGDLECGELCITYLSFSDFNLQLTKRSMEQATLPVPSPASLAQQALFGHSNTSRFLSQLWSRSRKTPISFNVMRTPSPPNLARYKFFSYAANHWASHTKNITPQSSSWTKFGALATCFSDTWDFHPWASGGRSTHSRLHALFGWAVKEKHEPLLTLAMDTGKSLHRVCDLPLIGESLPALHVSCKLGHVRITQMLLDICAANLPDVQGYTALHYAANAGYAELCRLLLQRETTIVNPVSKSGCTPLFLAAGSGHVEVAAILIDRGPDIETVGVPQIVCEDFCRRPIHEAASSGHLAVVNILIQRRAGINWRDPSGRTALSLAAENGHEAVTKLLLDSGADLEFCDAQARTPLSWAAESGHASIVTLLLDRGADVETTIRDGLTPLLWAVGGGYEGLVNLLLDKGAYIEARDGEDATALCYAAIRGDSKLVELLLERGAKVDGTGCDDKTPLSHALDSAACDWEVMQILYAWGADVGKISRL